MDRIIYPNGDTVAVFIPADGVDIADIADAVVPEGLPYRFIDEADIPDDRAARGRWSADFNDPDGISQGYAAWLAAHPPEEPQDDEETEQ